MNSINFKRINSKQLLSKNIRLLWNKIYGKILHDKWWDWLITKDTYAYIAYDNEPMGMICISKYNILVNNKVMIWNFLHNGGISIKHIGKGIYSKLYDYLIGKEQRVCYGFGNYNVLNIYLRRGATLLTNILTLRKSESESESKSKFKSKSFNIIPDVKIIHSFGWLNYRYNKNPRDNYKLYIVNNIDFMITKKYNGLLQIIYIDSTVNGLYKLLNIIKSEINVEIFLPQYATHLLSVALAYGYRYTNKILPIFVHTKLNSKLNLHGLNINIQAGDNDVF